MKHFIYTFFLLTLPFCGFSQWILSDSINLGEDQSTHSYSSFKSVALGDYVCGTNKTIRIGNGDSDSFIEFVVKVNANVDSVKIAYKFEWAGGTIRPSLRVDWGDRGKLPFHAQNTCKDTAIVLKNLSANTGDGSLIIKIWDQHAGFDGDAQIADFKIYSPISLSSVQEAYDKDLQIFTDQELKRCCVPAGNLKDIQSMEIFSVTGSKMAMCSNVENRFETDLHNFMPGIYLVNFISKKGLVVYRSRFVVR